MFKLLGFLIILPVCFLLSGYKPLKEINFFGVQYVRNYDGDTATVNIFEVHPILGREIGVRIAGIDTPEIGSGEKALKAKIYLEELLTSAKQIDLRKCTRGKYFRIVCDIMVDDQSVSSMIVGEGYSVWLEGSDENSRGVSSSKKRKPSNGKAKGQREVD